MPVQTERRARSAPSWAQCGLWREAGIARRVRKHKMEQRWDGHRRKVILWSMHVMLQVGPMYIHVRCCATEHDVCCTDGALRIPITSILYISHHFLGRQASHQDLLPTTWSCTPDALRVGRRAKPVVQQATKTKRAQRPFLSSTYMVHTDHARPTTPAPPKFPQTSCCHPVSHAVAVLPTLYLLGRRRTSTPTSPSLR
jgi:hypothetical protein